jgi:hypothetical protein
VNYRVVARPKLSSMLNDLRTLNDARTPGMWNPALMEFPPGDPDRIFMEWVTEYTGTLLEALNEQLLILENPHVRGDHSREVQSDNGTTGDDDHRVIGRTGRKDRKPKK